MKLPNTWSLLLIFALINYGNAYRILVINPAAAKSHYTIGKAAADILYEKGHEVNFIVKCTFFL